MRTLIGLAVAACFVLTVSCGGKADCDEKQVMKEAQACMKEKDPKAMKACGEKIKKKYSHCEKK